MNIIETSAKPMEDMKNRLTAQADAINRALQELHLPGISIQHAVDTIERQIQSAENKFTIAFLGTFKTGKSTIINSLLQLQGDARLSSEFEPDTAKCIRLVKKERRQKYEAEVKFFDGETERLKNWAEARKYTSQVELDNGDEALRRHAANIEEVVYYVDNDFLDQCNILDLPGTGTGQHTEHTDTTDKKIMEADCIFWVISTVSEPDREAVANLEKFSAKMLPIINVWQSEAEGIRGVLTPEEMQEILLNEYQVYFASAEKPVIYYAKEIDLAQQNGTEIKDEWGKDAFVDKVLDILQNVQQGDRMARIRANLRSALDECKAVAQQGLTRDDLNAELSAITGKGREINALYTKLSKCRSMVSGDIKNQAQQSVMEIIEIFMDASDAFISSHMTGFHMKAFRKKAYERELKEDFENNYVKLHSGWLDSVVSAYSESVRDIIMGAYSDFSLDMEEETSFENFDASNVSLSGFVATMAGTMAQEITERLLPSLIALITGGILLLIPGAMIIELTAAVLAMGINAITGVSNDQKLIHKQESVKIQSRCEIRQQKSVLVQKLVDMGQERNEAAYKKIHDEIDRRKGVTNDRLGKLQTLKNAFRELESLSDEFLKEAEQL